MRGASTQGQESDLLSSVLQRSNLPSPQAPSFHHGIGFQDFAFFKAFALIGVDSRLKIKVSSFKSRIFRLLSVSEAIFKHSQMQRSYEAPSFRHKASAGKPRRAPQAQDQGPRTTDGGAAAQLVEHQTSNIKHRTSNAQPLTSKLSPSPAGFGAKDSAAGARPRTKDQGPRTKD